MTVIGGGVKRKLTNRCSPIAIFEYTVWGGRPRARYRFSIWLPNRPVGLISRISSMMAKGAICASGA